MIAGVLSKDVESIWPFVEPLVQRVIDRFDMGYQSEHILEKLKARDQQLWLCGSKGIATTEITRTAEFGVLGVPIVAGDDMNEWLDDLFNVLRNFAKQHDCKFLEGYGREGWVRQLKPYGFEKYSTVVRMELDNG